MAINKTTEDKHGYSADYHYLDVVRLDRREMTATGVMSRYKSKADREAGKKAIGAVDVVLPLEGALLTAAVTFKNALEAAAIAGGGVLDGGTDTAD